MDAPPIQYTRTEDGVNIAYWTVGSGPPVVEMHNPVWSKVDEEWSVPSMRMWYERLAGGVRLTRFDVRGCGASDRTTHGLNLEGWLRDLDAVLDALGTEPVGLLGSAHIAQVALAFAAQHPERVTRLALMQPILASPESRDRPELDASVAISQANHELWAKTIAAWAYTTNSEEEERLTRFAMAAVSPDMQAALNHALSSVDIENMLSDLATPVLVLDAQDNAWSAGMAQRFAAAIPEAQLRMFEKGGGLALLRSPEAADAILDFFAKDEETRGANASPTSATSFRTILFTDVEESTLLTAQYGDAKARDLLQEHERLTREALAAHSGDEIKTMGDGFMVAFNSASAAIDAAIDMQRAITSHFAESPTPMRIRIGINAGEPIAQDDDLYGTAVIQAARIMSHADGGEILVSDIVRGLVAGKEYLFSQKGEYDLKGFEEAVRLFEVRWQDAN